MFSRTSPSNILKFVAGLGLSVAASQASAIVTVIPDSALYSEVFTVSGASVTVQSSTNNNTAVNYNVAPLNASASSDFGINRAFAQAIGSGVVGADSVWYDRFTAIGTAGWRNTLYRCSRCRYVECNMVYQSIYRDRSNTSCSKRDSPNRRARITRAGGGSMLSALSNAAAA